MDEAERCHRLAILDRGRMVAEGEPKVLAREIDAVVIEIGDAIRRRAARARGRRRGAQHRPARQPPARAAADAGRATRKRCCARRSRTAIRAPRVEQVGASLEDVFVAATKLRGEAARPGRAA